ncbi:hypothetical protein GOBAR_AA26117 [Gossypium barbadense]|uniref:Uncharacterized protein n=1 Tax=Gossypium barbadense TaxID=3634 RepID=A0A2P5WTY1_GOSBA|nr:hypothetical protein GOBAR_AA26117 [Gossypium barbadense]
MELRFSETMRSPIKSELGMSKASFSMQINELIAKCYNWALSIMHAATFSKTVNVNGVMQLGGQRFSIGGITRDDKGRWAESGAHDSYRIGSGLESRFSKGDH